MFKKLGADNLLSEASDLGCLNGSLNCLHLTEWTRIFED